MSDHISYFLNLHHHIIEAGEKLDNIYIVYTILLLNKPFRQRKGSYP